MKVQNSTALRMMALAIAVGFVAPVGIVDAYLIHEAEGWVAPPTAALTTRGAAADPLSGAEPRFISTPQVTHAGPTGQAILAIPWVEGTQDATTDGNIGYRYIEITPPASPQLVPAGASTSMIQGVWLCPSNHAALARVGENTAPACPGLGAVGTPEACPTLSDATKYCVSTDGATLTLRLGADFNQAPARIALAVNIPAADGDKLTSTTDLFTVTLRDDAGNSFPSSSVPLKLAPGPLDNLQVTFPAGAPATVVAGVPIPAFTLTARDQYGNVKTDFDGVVDFTSAGPNADDKAVLPPPARFRPNAGGDNGVRTFNPANANEQVIFNTPGTRTFQITESGDRVLRGSQPVLPGDPTPPHSVTVTLNVAPSAGAAAELRICPDEVPQDGCDRAASVGVTQLQAGDTRTFYAAAYDVMGSFLGVQPSTEWLLAPVNDGTYDVATLSASTGATVTVTFQKVGATFLTATYTPAVGETEGIPLKSAAGPFTVAAGAPATIRVGAVHPGPGAATDAGEIGAFSVTADEQRELHALVYDAQGNLVTSEPPLAVQWSMQGTPCGTVNKIADHATGSKATFEPTTVTPATGNTCRIRAHVATPSLSDDTGIVTVTPGQGVQLQIRTGTQPGAAQLDMANNDFVAGTTIRVYAITIDSDGNPVTQTPAYWAVAGTCGAVHSAPNGDPYTGALANSVIFQAVQAAGISDNCRVWANALTPTPAQPVPPSDGANTGAETNKPFNSPAHATTSPIEVSASTTIASLRIRAADTCGPTAGAIEWTAEQAPALHAYAYDEYGNCIGKQAATVWTLENAGAAPDEKLRLPGSAPSFAGGSVTLDPRRPATALDDLRVKATLVVSGTTHMRTTGTITITPGPLDSLLLRTAAANAGSVLDPFPAISSGGTQTIHAAGYDVDGNFVGDQASAWQVVNACGSVDPAAESATTTFTAGFANNAGCRVRATTAAGGVPGDSGIITVTTPPVDYLVIRDAANGAGTPVNGVTLEAGETRNLFAAGYDASDNYLGDQAATWTVLVNSGVACGTLSATATQATFTATKTGTDNCRVEARVNVAGADKTDETGAITVNPGPLDSISFGASVFPTSRTADQSFPNTITVTAYDAQGNVKTDYVGTLSWTTTSTAKALPADTPFDGTTGVLTFAGSSFSLRTTGAAQTVTATAGTGGGARAVTSPAIRVDPGALHNFLVSGATGNRVAGTAFGGTITVTARDQYDNAKTDYAGTVTWSTNDPSGHPDKKLPSSYTYVPGPGGDNGVHAFSGDDFALVTSGSRTFTVSDGGVTRSTSLTIDPAPVTTFRFTLPGQTFAPASGGNTGTPTNAQPGQELTVQLRALDAYGNVVGSGTHNYNGAKTLVFGGAATAWDGTQPVVVRSPTESVAFGSDTQVTFSNGVASSVKMKLFKRQSGIELTATASGGSPPSGTASPLNVDAGAAHHLGILNCAAANNDDRSCILRSDQYTSPWTPSYPGTHTLYARSFDEWDNMLGSETVAWASQGINPPIVTPFASQFTWTPRAPTDGQITISKEGLLPAVLEVDFA